MGRHSHIVARKPRRCLPAPRAGTRGVSRPSRCGTSSLPSRPAQGDAPRTFWNETKAAVHPAASVAVPPACLCGARCRVSRDGRWRVGASAAPPVLAVQWPMTIRVAAREMARAGGHRAAGSAARSGALGCRRKEPVAGAPRLRLQRRHASRACARPDAPGGPQRPGHAGARVAVDSLLRRRRLMAPRR